MKYLLDTHVFIWMDNDPDQLSGQVSSIIEQAGVTLLLSAVSVWEMQIKMQLGKLTLPLPLEDMVISQLASNRVTLLPLELAHVFALDRLPHYHRDPFDRMLVAQAAAEGATLLSNDTQLTRYPVPVVW